jgi:Fe-S-cluster-containing dehydrogenase component
MPVCPAGAINQREDGIVLITEEACTGCRLCVGACPFEAMQFDEEKKVAGRCNLCVERIDSGLKPACVDACLGHCIQFGEYGP